MKLTDLEPADRRRLDRLITGQAGNRTHPDPRGVYRPELTTLERMAAMQAAIAAAEQARR